jgi:nitrogen fixation protein FixH
MYNISLKDELVSETRRSFASKAAMDAWLQQEVEALLVAYNASQQAARRKARLVIADMRRQSEENGNASMMLDEINNEIFQARTHKQGGLFT